MNLQDYRDLKERLKREAKQPRKHCLQCFQPEFSCYCAELRPFDPGMKFVILIHPIEVKRRIATGRMSHMTLEGSHLIQGEEFDSNLEVQQILADQSLHPVILYPGRFSRNISDAPIETRRELFPANRKLAIFVIDGTWNTAKKMLHRSPNLKAISQICFTPPKPSTFRVRKQPAPGCVSTIEAIHETIELLGSSQGYNTTTRKHDALLDVFDGFVDQQIELAQKNRQPRQGLSYRRRQTA